MSLYNMIHGFNPITPIILTVLKKTSSEFPRFRDAYIKDKYMIVLTRTGGGNRESYKNENDEITKHPLYVKNHDDSYDSTYALWYFNLPEDFPIDKEILEKHNDPGIQQKFEKFIEKLKNE